MGSIETNIIAKNSSSEVINDACLEKKSVRPQRMHTWFNLIPVNEFEQRKPAKVLFLDTYATITSEGNNNYQVLFEDKQKMTVVVHVGIIFVWYGEHLDKPDRPFPKLFDATYPTKYITSKPSIFEDTHIMDFVENGSDNLHFKIVHQWNHSRIFDHKVTEERITLKQDTRFNYGSCSFNPFIRFMSKIIPELELTHDYVYHGPGMAVVNATGRGAPPFHALVCLTPEGPNRTRIYVTMALSPETFPAPLEKIYQTFRPKAHLADLLCGLMANYIQNEFDVDAVIWTNRHWFREPRLLNSEKHLFDVIKWGETFYPKGFEYPEAPLKTDVQMQWYYLDELNHLHRTRTTSYNVADQRMIAFLGSDDTVRVYDAYCPHQGAHLGSEFGGKIVDDCVRCPFHGFHFNADGACLGQNLKSNRTLEGLNLTAIQHRTLEGRVEVFV